MPLSLCRLRTNEKRPNDPEKADPMFEPTQVSSQNTADEEYRQVDDTDYSEQEGSDNEDEDVTELGLTAAASDVDRLQHDLEARRFAATFNNKIQ